MRHQMHQFAVIAFHFHHGPSRRGEHGHGGDLIVVLLLPLKITVASLVFPKPVRLLG